MDEKNASETERVESQEGDQVEQPDAFDDLFSENATPVEQERATGDELPQLTKEQLAKLIAANPDLAEALADAEPIRRRVQSEADKRLDRFRREMEQKAKEDEGRKAQETEQARVSELDDEDYGRYMREQQAKQQETQQRLQDVWQSEYTKIGQSLLNAIPDPAVRQQVNDGTYASWDEFREACVEAAIETRAKQKGAKRQKVSGEASSKEQTAEETEEAANVVSAAPPASSMASFRKLSDDEQWRIALREAFGKSSRTGRLNDGEKPNI